MMSDLADAIRRVLEVKGTLSRDEILVELDSHPAIVASSTEGAKREKLRRSISKMADVVKVGETVATRYRLAGFKESNYNKELLSKADELVTRSIRDDNGKINHGEFDDVTEGAIDILLRRGYVRPGQGVLECTGKAISFEPFEKKATTFSLPCRSVNAISELAEGLKIMSDQRSEIEYLGIVPSSDSNKSTIVALALEILLCVVRKQNIPFAES